MAVSKQAGDNAGGDDEGCYRAEYTDEDFLAFNRLDKNCVIKRGGFIGLAGHRVGGNPLHVQFP